MHPAARPRDAAWAASLDIGLAFEMRCAEKLRQSPGITDVRHDIGSTRKGYDMAFTRNGRPCTAECKCDKLAKQTGNFFIQTRKDGRAHGLITTTASYWFISIDDPAAGPILVIRPMDLLKHLSDLERQGGVKKVEKAGRSGNTTGYLMPVTALLACPGMHKWQ